MAWMQWVKTPRQELVATVGTARVLVLPSIEKQVVAVHMVIFNTSHTADTGMALSHNLSAGAPDSLSALQDPVDCWAVEEGDSDGGPPHLYFRHPIPLVGPQLELSRNENGNFTGEFSVTVYYTLVMVGEVEWTEIYRRTSHERG